MIPQIFFVCNDAERALGLEALLDLHIVSIDDSWLARAVQERTGKIFILEQELSQKNSIYRNSHKLLQEKSALEYIEKNRTENPHIMFFKIAPNLEFTSKALQLPILNTTSELNRRFENKLSQYEFLSSLNGVKLPKTVVSKLADLDHNTLSSNSENQYVIQFDRGHTGSGTIFIQDESELIELKEKFPNRPVRASDYIKGEAWTLNAVATRYGTIYGGLSYQITGIPELTSLQGATVGNDWSRAERLDDTIISKIAKMTEQVGNAMYRKGFRGLFGLDFIINPDDNEIYLIEINARQPASTGMHTKLMLRDSHIPLQLLHIFEHLELSLDQINELLNNINISTSSEDSLHARLKSQNQTLGRGLNASQFILRNNHELDVTMSGEITCGPRAESFVDAVAPTNEAHRGVGEFSKIYLRYSIDQIGDDEILLTTAGKGRVISPGSEFARVQRYGSVLTEEGLLKPSHKQLVDNIKKRIHGGE